MNARKFLISVGAAIASRKFAQIIANLQADDVLGVVGLERRRNHAMTGLGLLGLGAVVGAGTALLLAPAPGRQTRARLGHELNKLGKAAAEMAQEVADEAEPLLARIANSQGEHAGPNAHHTS
jgi:hypothetical protein